MKSLSIVRLWHEVRQWRLFSNTAEDVALLARVDQAHEQLSGPATRAILKREFEVYGKREFERLATLSNARKTMNPFSALPTLPQPRRRRSHDEKYSTMMKNTQP